MEVVSPFETSVQCAILVYGSTAEGAGIDKALASLIGQPVILQVALDDTKVPLRGKLLKDGGETLRIRIGDGWDVDIYKAMVLAVEEDSCSGMR